MTSSKEYSCECQECTKEEKYMADFIMPDFIPTAYDLRKMADNAIARDIGQKEAEIKKQEEWIFKQFLDAADHGKYNIRLSKKAFENLLPEVIEKVKSVGINFGVAADNLDIIVFNWAEKT